MAGCSYSSQIPEAEEKLLTGITATGDLGEKPTISFHTPMTVEDGAHLVLQEGDGEKVQAGDRVCVNVIVYNAEDGSAALDTWDLGQLDCSLVVGDKTDNTRYDIIKGQKLNSTIAFGVQDSSSSSSSSSSSDSSSTASEETKSYIWVITLISKSQDLTKASGEVVTDIPDDLPIITLLDENGTPSIDMNGFNGTDELIVQPLIKGAGEEVSSTDTVVVNYTGWLLDGSQFDSSWTRGSTFDASLAGGVIQGWTQGLSGQTVGSQVLLIIPPDLAYGDSEAGSIPAGSTLIFVVDILAKY